MKNIIAIEFFDKKYGDGAVIAWGNVFEEKELLPVVAQGLKRRFGAHDIEKIKLCNYLGEIKDHPYFYECLIRFIQEPIPTGKNNYNRWKIKKRTALNNRQDIYFNGFKSRYQDYLERKAKGFPDEDEL
jgi:hypothetical protein